MNKNNSFNQFTIPKLRIMRKQVKEAKTKADLLMLIDEPIRQKEYAATKSLNLRFPVEWFNIDQQHIYLLKIHGIDNLAQLRDIREEALYTIPGMTQMGYQQISWARDFFDMTPLESLTPEQRTRQNVVKELVKHANECSKKHRNI